MKTTFKCSCGKTHNALIDDYLVQRGAIRKIPEYLKAYGAKKCFLLCDENTYQAAGRQVEEVLALSGIPFSGFRYGSKVVAPDEKSVGSAIMHFDHSCDFVIGIGSGVINDIGKILSKTAKTPYMIVATAPSMDGYASASSSMTRDGLKISLPTRSANIIIGDLDVLCQAPLKMMKSGLGDMLAKYVSICEWRIASLITGEYYCEEIARLIREALRQCVENASGLLQRDEKAVRAVFEGLVIGGVAMNYAGVSRPASGVEHYISHILDMRSVEFGAPEDFHGIQCAIGTLVAIRLYEKLKTISPSKEKALAYAENFSWEDWQEELRCFLGKGAESMIALEEKEQKYSKENHRIRLDIILNNLDGILQIMDEELPAAKDLEKLLDTIEAPKSLEEIGISSQLLPMIFKSTKDIRDKYVLSRLAWDLGILDEFV
ncbi:MAG: sn-glycerol-1-phosphate dehydrogenase [Oscillospiraceae bacterium]|nr:sn-glycerol-1-phosphate dehydrogenase [Oscillospiraceae bacterium]